MYFGKMYPISKLDLISSDINIVSTIKRHCNIACKLVGDKPISSPYLNLSNLVDPLPLYYIIDGILQDYITEFTRGKDQISYEDLVLLITSPGLALIASAYFSIYASKHSSTDIIVKVYIYAICLCANETGITYAESGTGLKKEIDSILFHARSKDVPVDIVGHGDLKDKYSEMNILLKCADSVLALRTFTDRYTDKLGELTDLLYCINLAYQVKYPEHSFVGPMILFQYGHLTYINKTILHYLGQAR
jgi:hypothetical protein